MVHPSKLKKAAAKPTKRTVPTASSASVSNGLEPHLSEEDLAKRGEELREKAKVDGDELRDAFWLNLQKASEEPPQLVSEEDKKNLPRGLALKTKEETQASIEKAAALFEDKKFDEAAAAIDSDLPNAALEEEALGQLYQIRGKARFHQNKYFEAIRDLSLAKHLGFTGEGDTLFYRMRCYLELDLALYATLDYASLAADYSDYPDLKKYKSEVSAPISHSLKKLTSNYKPGRPLMLPPHTPYLDLVKVTIVLALQHNWGYEDLGAFLYLVKSTGYHALTTPAQFGRYLRDVFAANDMEDVSEVFTHYIPEHTVPIECSINEVVDAIGVMGEGCHLIHRIGFAMCFSLAWTPSSMWNLHATLFKDHLTARFAYQRALWHDYHLEAVDRVARGDDDVSYFCNGGIGEIPPPHARVDYLYVTDNAASDYIRLHAEATALKAEAVLEELKEHVPLNTFHVTLSPMIFAAARDAMPHSVRFILERGAECGIDSAEETPLDAAGVALEFRMEMLHDHGYIVPIEEFSEVMDILKKHGVKSAATDHDGFEHMFAGAGHSHGNDDLDEEEDEDGDYEEDGEDGDEEFPSGIPRGFEEYLRYAAAAAAAGQEDGEFDGDFDGEFYDDDEPHSEDEDEE